MSNSKTLYFGSDQTSAVDALLCFLSPPGLAGPRFAVTDVEIGQHTVVAGQTVRLYLASANHDPQRFNCTDELEPTRPAPHTAAAAVLNQLYMRWPGICVIDRGDTIIWCYGFHYRRTLTLPGNRA